MLDDRKTFLYNILCDKEIEKLNTAQEIERAKKNLRGETTEATRDLRVIEEINPENEIAHFEMDANIDSVEILNNSELAELIPILALFHSVKKSVYSKEKKHILKSSTPILLGYYHGQGKPDIKKFLAPLLQDLKRLHLDNQKEIDRAFLQFTVTLRCIRTDASMRAYLKGVKCHSGYWSCERCIQRGIPWPLRPTVSKTANFDTNHNTDKISNENSKNSLTT